jgi:hypothetical protein
MVDVGLGLWDQDVVVSNADPARMQSLAAALTRAGCLVQSSWVTFTFTTHIHFHPYSPTLLRPFLSPRNALFLPSSPNRIWHLGVMSTYAPLKSETSASMRNMNVSAMISSMLVKTPLTPPRHPHSQPILAFETNDKSMVNRYRITRPNRSS